MPITLGRIHVESNFVRCLWDFARCPLYTDSFRKVLSGKVEASKLLRDKQIEYTRLYALRPSRNTL